MTQELEQKKSPGVLLAVATRYGMDGAKFLETLKGTVMKPDRNGRVPTNEEIAAFLLVAKEYGLNPFTKEIYAFPDKRAGIIPVVGLDGWNKLMNDHPQFNGFDMNFSDEMVEMDDNARPCHEWAEIRIYRKDRDFPIIIREYLDEVYQAQRGDYPGPWQTHTKRMLRHKTIIQGARIAFGFSGIYDEDEAQRIAEMQAIEIETTVVSNKPKVLPPKAKDQKNSEPAQTEPLQDNTTKGPETQEAPSSPWTIERIIATISSAQSINALDEAWKILTPHIAKLNAEGKAQCQKAKDTVTELLNA